MMIADVERKADALVSVLAAEPTVLAAWLFGSVAAGRSTPLSDIDFAVLLTPGAPQRLDRIVLLDRLAQGLARLLDVTDGMVDVVCLNDQSIVFQHAVLRTGRLLYERDTKARQHLVWRTIVRYLDFKPTLEIFDRAKYGGAHS